MTGAEVLNLPMTHNDAKAKTVKEYLLALLMELWSRGESFSGKRPFGNSGWEDDLYKPLVAAGAVAGKLDDEGYVESVDDDAAGALIVAAIESLGSPVVSLPRNEADLVRNSS